MVPLRIDSELGRIPILHPGVEKKPLSLQIPFESEGVKTTVRFSLRDEGVHIVGAM